MKLVSEGRLTTCAGVTAQMGHSSHEVPGCGGHRRDSRCTRGAPSGPFGPRVISVKTDPRVGVGTEETEWGPHWHGHGAGRARFGWCGSAGRAGLSAVGANYPASLRKL